MCRTPFCFVIHDTYMLLSSYKSIYTPTHNTNKIGLVKLHLSDCPNVDERGLVPLLENCPLLRHLDLHASIGVITNEVAKAIVEHSK